MNRPGISRLALVLGFALIAVGCTTIDRVSTSSSDGQSNADTAAVAVSGTGRYVAFQSSATNLAAGVTNGQPHVYRKDRATGVTVNIDRRGIARANAATLGAISDDGNRVAFITVSALVAIDTNGLADAYVRDVAAGTTVLASLLPDGSVIPHSDVNAGVLRATFDRGRHLLFEAGTGSAAVPGSLGFVRDLVAGTTVVAISTGFHDSAYISRDGNHLADNYNCGTPRDCIRNARLIDLANPYPFTPTVCDGADVAGLSDDGRYVVYNRAPGSTSCSNPPVPGRYDRQTGTWVDLGVPTPAASNVRAVGISGDGRFVLLVGDDRALSGGTLGFQGAFVLDVSTGWSSRVTADQLDRAANASGSASDAYVISGDGRTVAFTSAATNLVPGDSNGLGDGFARATARPRVTGCTPSSLSQGASHRPVAVSGAEFLPGATAEISGGGVTVHSATPSADGHTLTLDVSVAPDATPFDFRDVIVSNVGGFGHAGGVPVVCLKVLN